MNAKLLAFTLGLAQFYCAAAETTSTDTSRTLVVSANIPPSSLEQESSANTANAAISLAQALQSARKIRAGGWKGPIILHLLAGTYRLPSGIGLAAADSGLAGAPLIIEGEDREHVRITGSKLLTPSKPPADDPVLERIPMPARQSIITFNLRTAGVPSWMGTVERGFGVPDKDFSSDLFCNGYPMMPAHWPSQNYANIVGIFGSSSQPVVQISPAIPDKWTDASGAWALGFWQFDWSDQLIPVKIMKDSRIILSRAPIRYGIAKGQRVRLQGFPEALDQPGEWYLDEQRGIIYLFPSGNGPAPEMTEISVLPTVIFMDGVKHVLIRNLTLGESRGDLLVANNADDVRLERVTVQNAGRMGVKILGVNSGIAYSTVINTGGEGIWISGGDRQTLKGGGLFVTDSIIEHFATKYLTYHAGIYIGGVGVDIEHNIISHGSHSAILLDGNNHYIGHNEISDVVRETGDAGAIYSGRDWTARGTVIESNFFHDISGVGLRATGVYLDDQWSGITIRGNTFVRIHNNGILLGGGSDNTITGNLFVSVTTPIYFDARGMTWTKINTLDPHYALQQRLHAVPYKSGAYAQQYPTLPRLEEDGLGVPLRNIITKNLTVASGQWHIDLASDLLPRQIIEGNWSTNDPTEVFAPGTAIDKEVTPTAFELPASSQWVKEGFPTGPLKDVGPRPH